MWASRTFENDIDPAGNKTAIVGSLDGRLDGEEGQVLCTANQAADRDSGHSCGMSIIIIFTIPSAFFESVPKWSANRSSGLVFLAGGRS